MKSKSSLNVVGGATQSAILDFSVFLWISLFVNPTKWLLVGVIKLFSVTSTTGGRALGPNITISEGYM